MFVLTLSLGANAGASMNPAADLMPRLMASAWTQDLQSFTATGHFWLVPFLLPYLGGVLGVITYQLLIVNMRPQRMGPKKVQFVERTHF